MITFQCKICGGTLTVDDKRAGQSIYCKFCNCVAQVPDQIAHHAPPDNPAAQTTREELLAKKKEAWQQQLRKQKIRNRIIAVAVIVLLGAGGVITYLMLPAVGIENPFSTERPREKKGRPAHTNTPADRPTVAAAEREHKEDAFDEVFGHPDGDMTVSEKPAPGIPESESTPPGGLWEDPTPGSRSEYRMSEYYNPKAMKEKDFFLGEKDSSETTAENTPPADQSPAEPESETGNQAVAMAEKPDSSTGGPPLRTPEEDVPEKMPVPDEKQLARARKLIEEVYGEQLRQGKTNEEKIKVAALLIEDARSTSEPADKFAVLSEAAVLASRGGGIDKTFDALEEMQVFDDPLLDLKINIIKNLLMEGEPDRQESLSRRCLGMINDAIAEDRYELAQTFARYAVISAKKARNTRQAGTALAVERDLEKLVEVRENVAAALDTLRNDPDNPSANLATGKFFCFVKQDWRKGLPHLARCDTEPYQAIAEIEQGTPEDTDTRNKLADAWWEMADEHTGIEKQNIRVHAACWYKKAIPGLSGLLKRKALNRMQECGQDAGTAVETKNAGETPVAGETVSAPAEKTATGLPWKMNETDEAFGTSSKENTGGLSPKTDAATGAGGTTAETPASHSKLPAGFKGVDIGDVGCAGSDGFEDGVYTIKAAGRDIYGETDSFRYVYTSLSGDGGMAARLTSFENTNEWTKVGVMIRENLDPRSSNVTVGACPGGISLFGYRVTTGEGTGVIKCLSVSPHWLKVERRGCTITGYISIDGKKWSPMGAMATGMDSNVCIGMALTSHDNARICTATFDNVVLLDEKEVNNNNGCTLHLSFDDVWKRLKPKDARWTEEGKDGGGLLLSSKEGVLSYLPVGKPLLLKKRPFSVSAWIKTEETALQTIVERGAARYGYSLFTKDGKAGFAYRWDDGNRINVTQTQKVVADGKWHCLTTTMGAGGRFAVVVDGEIVQYGKVYLMSEEPGDPTIIGESGSCNIFGEEKRLQFNGIIDDVRFYDRSLNKDEIKKLAVP